MKLSRTAWNNVIIFSVMALILIINFTNDELNPSQERLSKDNEVEILSAHQHILTLAINQEFLVERIGKTWRAMPAKLSEQALEQMIYAWQQSSGVTIASEPQVLPENATKVTLELAGESQPLILSLYLVNQQLLAFNHQKNIWLQLPAALYQQLLPAAIFTE